MALSKTITDGLKPYSLGAKLRALRLKKSMGLMELSNHTGLSAAMLSKLERDKLVPTLPTLLRISLVFSVSLDYFFADERKRHVVALMRKSERIRFPERPGLSSAYFFESLDFMATERKLNAFYADFEPAPPGKARGHQHPGVEFLFVTRGRLDLTIGSDTHRMAEGDSVYFDSSVRHGYGRVGKPACSALIVTVP
jgi:transcriptional regulator with XRE-family HTH domain